MDLLVVEDERRMLELLRKGLTEEGHFVRCATDGIEGLRMVLEQQFDAVILDVMMPNLNGFEMAHQMRRVRNFTPILMLTAKDSVPDVVRGLDLGADEYMTKPFSFKELLLRLRAVTRYKRTAAALQLRTAALLLDRSTHEVFCDRVRVPLTRNEFSLLERLMRDAGRVVAREALVEAVWGRPDATGPNTLDALVRLLRKKIEGDHDRRTLIRTVRGSGYAICAEKVA